jgi:hypothetical protein
MELRAHPAAMTRPRIIKTLITCGGGLRIWLRASAEANANADVWGCPKSSREQRQRATTCCTCDTVRDLRTNHKFRINATVYDSARQRNHCTMPLSSKLDRKLRAAEESSDGEDYYEVTDRSSSESIIETGAGGGEVISSGDEDEAQQDSQDDATVSCRGLAPRTSEELTSASQMHPTTTRSKHR